MNKTELRRKAQSIMRTEFGFAPTQKQIVLLEASGDGSYIMWGVGRKEYQYRASYIDRFGRFVSPSFEVTDSHNGKEW